MGAGSADEHPDDRRRRSVELRRDGLVWQLRLFATIMRIEGA
jgi:hypothetical protein